MPSESLPVPDIVFFQFYTFQRIFLSLTFSQFIFSSNECFIVRVRASCSVALYLILKKAQTEHTPLNCYKIDQVGKICFYSQPAEACHKLHVFICFFGKMIMIHFFIPFRQNIVLCLVLQEGFVLFFLEGRCQGSVPGPIHVKHVLNVSVLLYTPVPSTVLNTKLTWDLIIQLRISVHISMKDKPMVIKNRACLYLVLVSKYNYPINEVESIPSSIY